MGRKAQAKKMRRLCQEATALARRQAKAPCATCAFRDPECWMSNKDIGRKLLACLAAGTYFWCHDGMDTAPADGEAGVVYQPPRRADGTIDTTRMTPCGGYVRWAQALRDQPPRAREAIVARLQEHMLRRFLNEDPDVGATLKAQGLDPKDLAMVVNRMVEETWEEAGER